MNAASAPERRPRLARHFLPMADLCYDWKRLTGKSITEGELDMNSEHLPRTALIAGLAIAFSGAAASAAPNLQVVNLTVDPPSIGQGQKATLEYMLGNNGNMDTSAFKVGFYFSEDSVVNASDTLLATVDIQTIAATTNLGEMTVEVTIPTGASLGTRYIGAIADPTNAVVENNESDNSNSVLVSIVAAPDLTVTALTVSPTTAVPGGDVEISYTVTNQGASPTGTFTTRLYYSDDAVITAGDTALSHERETTLAAGSTTGTVVAVVKLPATASPGSRYVGAITDSKYAVAEGNENNNTRAANISIGAPTCFGKAASDAAVCGGNGTCVAADTCSCAPGYSGSECETFNDCSGQPDWTSCGQGVCFDEVCEPAGENNRCQDAIGLEIGGQALGDLEGFRPFETVPQGCIGKEISGPDAFFSFQPVSGHTYVVTATPHASMDIALVAWRDCTLSDLYCLTGSDAAGNGQPEEITIDASDETVILHVVGVNAATTATSSSFSIIVNDVTTTTGDEGRPDTLEDTSVGQDAVDMDPGVQEDMIATDVGGDDTETTKSGGCSQSGGSNSRLILLLVAGFVMAFRRRPGEGRKT